jgi:hypothetical protein
MEPTDGTISLVEQLTDMFSVLTVVLPDIWYLRPQQKQAVVAGYHSIAPDSHRRWFGRIPTWCHQS